jgi:chorismate dehydratase
MPRIGSVPYLNAMPLVEDLGQWHSLVFQPPAKLHELVEAQKLDVALLPVLSYLENPELRLIPGTGIVSHGEVRSVKVFHQDSKINLANTRSIYLDPHSKTSQRLLKILLLKKYQRDMNEIVFTDKPHAADSLLEIGDRALEKSHYGNSTDLGLEWSEWTGLPFVFACWMSQTPITQELLTQLHNAKMTGKQSLEQIASRQKILSEEEALSYLTHNIQYDIEGPELVGMKTFFEWVEELENRNYDTSLRFVA